MPKRTIVLLIALGACSQEPREASTEQPAATGPVPTAPLKQAAMVSLPKDPAKLKRLEAMGYTVHEDHLHAPGVSACPKMSDDPIM